MRQIDSIFSKHTFKEEEEEEVQKEIKKTFSLLPLSKYT